MINLDNNTTTRLAPEVLDAMASYASTKTANIAAIEKARLSVATLLGVDEAEKIAFIEGAEDGQHQVWASVTERPAHVITTGLETPIFRNICQRLESEGCYISRVAVDGQGILDLDQLRTTLTTQTSIVMVSHADAETGNIHPLNEIVKIVKENSNALTYVDGTNAVGNIPVDLSNSAIDNYYIVGNAFHAPNDIGALFSRRVERDPSRKTEEHFALKIVGTGVAAELVHDVSAMENVRRLRDEMESEILEKIPNSRLNGAVDPTKRLPNTANISFENTNGEAIVARLSEAGIRVSTSSACASKNHTASPSLQAMGVPYSVAMGSIRFSLSRYTTAEEIAEVLRVLPGVIADLRRISGYDR